MCKYLETNWGGKKGMTSFLSRSYELMLHDAHSEGLWQNFAVASHPATDSSRADGIFWVPLDDCIHMHFFAK